MRILLCDDDPMILVQMEKYLKEYFQKAHLRVPDIASYTSGDALLRSESTAEIAFLDVEIPGLSGIYTGEKLKKKNPSIKIFILTSYMDYTKEQQLSFIDTYDVFQKYQWAENEFSKLGNVPNRIRGMKLNPIFLKDLYEYSLECKELSILLINSEEGESVSLPIKDRLLMSAVEREKAIKWISEVLE